MAVKYVDDMTAYHATNNPSDDTLQTSINTAIAWSKANKMMRDLTMVYPLEYKDALAKSN